MDLVNVSFVRACSLFSFCSFLKRVKYLIEKRPCCIEILNPPLESSLVHKTFRRFSKTCWKGDLMSNKQSSLCKQSFLSKSSSFFFPLLLLVFLLSSKESKFGTIFAQQGLFLFLWRSIVAAVVVVTTLRRV